jgi:hypothetical protein
MEGMRADRGSDPVGCTLVRFSETIWLGGLRPKTEQSHLQIGVEEHRTTVTWASGPQARIPARRGSRSDLDN